MPAKERPIIFSGPMVKAILEGRKTQTRRVVKLRDPSQTYSIHDDDGWPMSADDAGEWHRDRCPYGKPGDRLWVRETFRHFSNSFSAGQNRASVIYAADEAHRHIPVAEWPRPPKWWNTGKYPWTSPIHMPRWACRIVLELTDVRVERLQDISEQAAIAEGVQSLADYRLDFDERANFSRLWDTINGDWDTNPWVWVLEFHRIEEPQLER